MTNWDAYSKERNIKTPETPKSIWGIEIPKYKKDVLHRLRHIDGVPACIKWIEHYTESIRQALCDATTEIEKLRKENRSLKRKIKNK